ncbi:MAG: Rne/Rng family ribonuclease [Actinobacteria bacterium]|nr:Rne/Rng family ribonuclease [Actinomycetota bacterium]
MPTKRPPLPPAKRELLVSVDVGEQRVAVLENDRVAEVYLERPERRSIAGNIYKGSVDNVLPGMEAAFVEIGLERNGFLYVDEIVVPELEGKRHGRKIQDLLSRGQEIMVQAVKDPMKSKGARLTTEISLPGRFVVYVPHGEGIGVSRRLEDDERVRLRDILKSLELPSGGIIVRTAAEGASAEDVERDVLFLERLWKTIQARSKQLSVPALVYQEAELPLRVVRDLFTGDFERAVIDHDLTHRRVVGYLKKTSPHMVERVSRHRDKERLFEAFGVDAEIRSTLSRRVDLPSGGYLVFDYAEAFTVIDVNTGRFTGSRSKSSGSGLEETITKNNLEAVKEVVRQLRLRDIGGIIVIDFIDMANPKNRAQVEEALKDELARDRTKTYVVEISPLGLVEMTRQNVTDGPREILTKKCPTCAGDGIVVSESTAAVEIERRLRALAARSRNQAFRVEVNARVASLIMGPGAARLAEIETQARRRFFLETKDDVHADHFLVLAQGKLEDLMPAAPLAEGASVDIQLGEVALYDPTSAVGRVDGYPVTVAGAAKRVGKKVKVRIERVSDGEAYASLLRPAPEPPPAPVTAESEAEKPTRKSRAKKATVGESEGETVTAEIAETVPEAPPEVPTKALVDAPGAEHDGETGAVDTEEKPKRKTRRGSRGGRGRKRKPAAVEASENGDGQVSTDDLPAPRIHLPDQSLGRSEPLPAEDATNDGAVAAEADPPADGDGERPKRKTRRGTRGGRNRRKKPAAAVAEPEAGIESGG